jgi:drug/metabolite transporter (DMT)-like permease
VRPRPRAGAGTLRDRPLLLIGIGVLLFSTGPVMVAGTDTSGPVLSFWRLWSGALLMGVLTLWQIRVTGRRPDRVGWSWAMRCGLVFGIHQLFFMVAIKETSVVDVTLMQVVQPLFVGFLAALLFGERPGARFRLWSLVAIAGAAVVVLAGASGPEGDPLGVTYAALNVAFFAVYFVWSKQARDHIDTVPFLFGVVATAGVFVGLFVLVTGEVVGSISGHDLALAVAIAALPGALGHFVTTWPLARVPANVPPVMQLAMPFLAGGLAWVVLDQEVTALHVAGGLVTVAGVVGALLSPSGAALARPGPDPMVVPGD